MEGLMLKLKLQYFGYLMLSANPPAAQVGVFLWIGALHLWELTVEDVKTAFIV